MPTKQDYMEIIEQKLDERPESQEKSEKTEVDGLGQDGSGADVPTKEEYH
ncbi:MAG: hypothetical protein ABEI78_00365 [Candidatus Nanohaloarchaea archaeon]